jgi:N-acetylneuraminic acid mutarotase
MNTDNHQWSTAADLPEPLYLASAAVCGDQLYMLGGIHRAFYYTESVYTCSLTNLLHASTMSCASSSRKSKLKRRSLEDRTSMWRRVADFPNGCSTCQSFHGQLLAIGGSTVLGNPTPAVYVYDSTTDSWEIISHMTTGRYRCFTAVLPDNRLMVTGGIIAEGSSTDTIEFMSMCN